MSIRLYKKGESFDWMLLLADLAFVFCIVTNILSAHDRLGQCGLVVFGAAVLVLIIRKRAVAFDRFFIGYGLFILWGLIGVLAGWACDKQQAFAMVKTLVIDFGFLFLVYQYLKSRDSLDGGLQAYTFAALLTTVLVLTLSGPRLWQYRFGWCMGVNPNKLADMLLPGWCASLYLAIGKKRKLMLIPALILFAAIVATGSRQGMLGGAVFTVIYVLWTDREHIVRDLLIMFALAGAAFAALLLIPALKWTVGDRLMNTIKGYLGLAETAERSIVERKEFSEAAIRLFKERPLTGWGYDCYRFASGTGTYAHNNYFELLADGGLPALLLFYVPVLSVLVRAFLKAKVSDEARFGAILMPVLLVLGIASVSYYDRVDLILIPYAAFTLGSTFPKERAI